MTFEENGLRFEVIAGQLEEPPRRWASRATAYSLETEAVVGTVQTIALHGSEEDADRIALAMLRDKLAGIHVAE